jgi:riboflavin synthase
MFTGIVSDCGTIASVAAHGSSLKRLRIHASYDAVSIALGASIACAGVCLTVVAFGARPEGGCWFEVDAAAETLALTTVGQWIEGKQINLERALKIGDELGGHLVSGHVDGLAQIIAREEVTAGEAGSGWGATTRFVLSVPSALSKFIAVKGSVALDGTSLTINTVENDQFSVLLIPHTLQVTTWGQAKAGDLVNLEVDQMARYAARLAEVAARR